MIVVKTKLSKNPCSYYFALEEYFLKKQDKEDYFFLWQIDRSLVIGRHQSLYDEIDVSKANEDGVTIYRRPSGGGAVYADENCLMFSFITPNFDTKMVFHTYLDKMVHAFHAMNIPATFSGRNDLLLDGKKFSGNAFYRLGNHACLHGTLLFQTELEKMGRYLTPNKAKLQSKGIQSVSMRVTNIASVYPHNKAQFISSLLALLGGSVVHLSDEEEKTITHMQKKYEKEDWIYRKTPYTKQIATHTAAGSIVLHFILLDGIIQQAFFRGDYFLHRSLEEVEQTFVHQPYDIPTILAILKQSQLDTYIYDLEVSTWLKQVEDAMEKASSHPGS